MGYKNNLMEIYYKVLISLSFNIIKFTNTLKMFKFKSKVYE